jgi:hypothetical protein
MNSKGLEIDGKFQVFTRSIFGMDFFWITSWKDNQICHNFVDSKKKTFLLEIDKNMTQ